MERNQDLAPEDAEPCSCCGLATATALASETGGACEWCAGYPYGPSCCYGKHADELRAELVGRVVAGTMDPLLAVARMALDDAHHAGRMRSTLSTWVIDRTAPTPPNCWERLTRMAAVDRTIRGTVTELQRRRVSSLVEIQRTLADRLSSLTGAGFGSWRVEVSRSGLDIEPPPGFIQPDTTASRRRATVEYLEREAAVN